MNKTSNEQNDVSAILPVYIGDNYSKVKSAVDSLLNQTYKLKQILIVCDGEVQSEIDSYLSSIQSNYDNVEILKLSKNLGLPAALNYAIKKNNCELILRADADDVNSLTRVEKQVQYLRENKLDILGSKVLEIDEEHGSSKIKNLPLNHDEIISYACYRNPFNHMSILMKSEVLSKVRGYPEAAQYKEDYMLWIKCIGQNFRFGNMNDTLVHVTAGHSQLKRRHGFKKNFKSEYILLREKLTCNIWPRYHVICSFFIRVFILSLPIEIFYMLYKHGRK